VGPVVDLEDAEARRVLGGDLDCADGALGAGLDVILEHVAVVHLVNVVSGQDHDVIALHLLQELEVLGDGVGRASVPAALAPVLGRSRHDELGEPAGEEVPGQAQVLLERVGLVLREHEDSTEARVDHVG